MDGEDEGRVGYARPPRHTRFRKGQSGNPHGRPKGSGMRSAIEKVLDRKVTATIDGYTRKVPLTEALAMQLVQKALKGDAAASRELMRAMTQLDLAKPPDPKKERPNIVLRWMVDPQDCNPALAALGVIADIDGRYKVEPWVVEVAKARGVKLKEADKALVANSTRKPGEKASHKLLPMPGRNE